MSSKQQTRNGDENNNNDNNNQYYWAMDEEERLEYHQSIVAYVSIAFAVVYTILSFTAYCKGVSIPELLAEDADSWQNLSHTEIAKGSARLDMLQHLWSFLSPATVLSFLILLIITGEEEDDLMRNDGNVFNLLLVLVWLVIVSIALAVKGFTVLGKKSKDGTLGVGFLTGGVTSFSWLLFLVFLLYTSPLFEERRPEDGPATATALCVLCLFLSSLHLAFGMWIKKYRVSISSAIPVDDEDDGYIAEDDTGFVHVDRRGMELA